MSEPEQGKCPSREELLSFRLAKLSEAALETISSHLQECDTCVATVATLDDGDDSLIQGLRRSSPDDRFLDESQCQLALEKLELIGCDPSFMGQIDKDAHEDIPKELGRYQILEELGRGGMGTVYLAQDTQLDRQVALKIPHFRRRERPRLVERFYRVA